MHNDDRDAFTIPEFCRRHRFSVSHYFDVKREGGGPREMRIGKRVLISREAAADWRRSLEGMPERVPA
jgi:hypothetical protein